MSSAHVLPLSCRSRALPLRAPRRSLAISLNEEQLALSLGGGAAFTLALHNQELLAADGMNFEPLGAGGHTSGCRGAMHVHEGMQRLHDAQPCGGVRAAAGCRLQAGAGAAAVQPGPTRVVFSSLLWRAAAAASAAAMQP